MADRSTQWGLPLASVVCPNCNTEFLRADKRMTRCLHCFRAELVEKSADDLPFIGAPERIIPFNADMTLLQQQCDTFARSVWIRPIDLTAENLAQRLQKVFLPHWIVGSRVTGKWQAELGYDYQVVSHIERYASGSWQTDEVKKTRTDWEPRVAEVNLQYDDIRTPALENFPAIIGRVGQYNMGYEIDFSADAMQDALLLIPDRHGDAPWQDVYKVIQQKCQEDSITAGKADRIREFQWQVECPDQRWTHQLLPIYKTFYADDDGNLIPLLMHGHSGKIDGVRRGSMQKAKRYATLIGAVALLLLLVTLGTYFAQLDAVFVWAQILFALTVLAALIPLVYVWALNRQSAESEWIAK